MSRWWGAGADRGDTERLEAFSDGVLAIAFNLIWHHLARAELLEAGLTRSASGAGDRPTGSDRTGRREAQ
ncbi:MAG: hypothetical protein WAL99_21705 [Pseudonocardiaceae bacterium]